MLQKLTVEVEPLKLMEIAIVIVLPSQDQCVPHHVKHKTMYRVNSRSNSSILLTEKESTTTVRLTLMKDKVLGVLLKQIAMDTTFLENMAFAKKNA